MAIYDQKCKLSKRTNRQISLALLSTSPSSSLTRWVNLARQVRRGLLLSDLISFCLERKRFKYLCVRRCTEPEPPPQQQNEHVAPPMGRLLISRADYRATSARRRTTAHPTVVRRFLCSGYVLSKKVSCVLMNMIFVTII
jgi:hypothetical protein